MRKAPERRACEDKFHCPRCFESGTAAIELVQIRPSRRPGNYPYLLTRRHRCPSCGSTFASVERLGLATLRRATERASVASEDSTVENQDTEQGQDSRGYQDGETPRHNEP